MIQAIEVQYISRLLTTESEEEIAILLGFDLSYFSAYKQEVEFIFNHKHQYDVLPSIFEFQAQFDEFTFVQVNEPISYLVIRLNEYKQYLVLLETFNKIKDLGTGDVRDAWIYLQNQCNKVAQLSTTEKPLDIVHQSEERAERVKELAKQKRISTGFSELDKLMYGGLSTVEELLVIIARMGSGKSWMCAKFMETAQKNGFPVAYYSPEMQGEYLALRFDTWRGHFQNSSLYKGEYLDEYVSYIKSLPTEEAPAYILEDKYYPEGVSPRLLDNFVKQNNIKLLIIDGISYMIDDQKASITRERYKNIAKDLFTISKKYGCAVVLVMQANREVKSKDDKGESIPELFNAEESDWPGRIATQALGIRQIFEKHVLDVKMLKSRSALNSKQILSYSWDVNTGNMSYIPGDTDSDSAVVPEIKPDIASSILPQSNIPDTSGLDIVDDDTDVEF